MGISGGELFLVFLIFLLLFGSNQLPGIFRMVGKAVNEVQRAKSDIAQEIHRVSVSNDEPFNDVKVEFDDTFNEENEKVGVKNEDNQKITD